MERKYLMKQSIESYTDGDTNFFVEFTENIHESVQSVPSDLTDIDKSKDTVRLGKLIHLIKPTIEILGENELINQLDELKENWKYGIYPNISLKMVIKRFAVLSDDLHDLITEAKGVYYVNAS